MSDTTPPEAGRVLILGSTGFVGARLVSALAARGVALRLLVRSWTKARSVIPDGADVEVIHGDLGNRESLERALRGIRNAYYLVHSMGGRSLFADTTYAKKDLEAAKNFMAVAEESGLARVIYLGALGESGTNLSPHLRSRAAVAEVLASGSPAATILRSAIIIGAQGASFEMLRYLVERLPIMACPKWIDSRIQPIALQDVVAYLVGCLFNPETAGQTFDIGGAEVFTYREMMQQYAQARGLAPRLIFRLPFLTPLLSVYWVDLVTPVPSGVAHPLVEGLKSEMVCREDRIAGYLPVDKTSFAEAVQIAVSEETSGPGTRRS